MKKVVIFLVILLFITINVCGDNLSAVVGTGTATTSSSTYADVATTAALSMVNVDKVLVFATFTCQSTVSTNVKRILTFRLHDNTPTTPLVSGEIERYLQQNKIGDKGIGSLVYIFDVSGSDERTFSLQHKVNQAKNTETKATIVAIALNTDTSPYPILDNDIKSITTAVSTRNVSSSFGHFLSLI